MDGKAIGDAIVGAIVAAFIVGGVVAIGLWNLVAWLIHHVHLGWS